MKKLYTFKLFKEETFDREHIIKDPETGEDLKTTKKVKEVVEKEYCIIRPNRGMRDQAELFYNKSHSDAIRGGIMPLALLSKRVKDDDGLLSKTQEKEYIEILQKISDKQKELEKLEDKANLEKIKEINNEVNILRGKMREIQDLQASIFDNTAEGFARRKTIFWWFLNLSYYVENEQLKPFFGDGDFSKKLAKYDEYEVLGDDFIDTLLFKFNYYTNLWYVAEPKDEEAFKKAIEIIEKDFGGASIKESESIQKTPETEEFVNKIEVAPAEKVE